ncbi:MAG: type II toxin-antitoxin system HicB family antitoxin [Bacillota bacterium]|nr:type II toxin-antitoxin system HicB family antitoxin [Bacillota bacterium]
MGQKDVYRFWAIFDYADDGISVEFPDLPGCLTCGDTADEAYEMAKDALKLHLWGMEKDNDEIPEPSTLHDIINTLEKNQTLVDIQVYMPPFRDAMETRAIKKTLTIPKWLNDLAEKEKINFSHVLQSALKQSLGLSDHRAVTKK